MSFLESLQHLDTGYAPQCAEVLDNNSGVSANPQTSTPTIIAAFIGKRKGSRGVKGEKRCFADFNDNNDE
jgi:hypothetical protein